MFKLYQFLVFCVVSSVLLCVEAQKQKILDYSINVLDDTILSVQDEFSRWKSNKDISNSNVLLECNGFRAFGGPRIFTNSSDITTDVPYLPTHNEVIVRVTALLIGKWSEKDKLSIFIEDKEITSINTKSQNIQEQKCSNISLIQQITIDTLLIHNQSTLKIAIKDNIQGSQDKSWAIREVKFKFYKSCNNICKTCTFEDKCKDCSFGAELNPKTNQCQCLKDHESIFQIPQLCERKIPTNACKNQDQSVTIQDLTNDILSLQSVKDWDFEGNVDQQHIQQCYSAKFFGLFKGKSFARRTLKNLPPHFKALIAVTVYFRDNLLFDEQTTQNNQIIVKINGDQVGQLKPKNRDLRPLCGINNQVENFYRVYQEVSTGSENLEIQIEANLESGLWGLKDVKIFLYKCPSTCKQCLDCSNCTACKDGFVLKNNTCTCEEGFQLNESFQCTKINLKNQTRENQQEIQKQIKDNITQNLTNIQNNSANQSILVNQSSTNQNQTNSSNQTNNTKTNRTKSDQQINVTENNTNSSNTSAILQDQSNQKNNTNESNSSITTNHRNKSNTTNNTNNTNQTNNNSQIICKNLLNYTELNDTALDNDKLQKQWKIEPTQQQTVQKFGNVNYFGIFKKGTTITKIFNDTQPFFSVRIKCDLYIPNNALNQSEFQKAIQLIINSTQVNFTFIPNSLVLIDQQLIKTTWEMTEFFKTSDSKNLKLELKILEGSWALKNIQYQICQCHQNCDSCQEENKCLACRANNTELINGECECKEGFSPQNNSNILVCQTEIIINQVEEACSGARIVKITPYKQESLFQQYGLNQQNQTQNNSNNKILKCGSSYWQGLFGQEEEITVKESELPPHFAMIIQGEVMFRVKDGSIVNNQTSLDINQVDQQLKKILINNSKPTYMCGGNDLIDNFVVQTFHYQRDLNLRFESNRSTDDVQWAFKNIIMDFCLCNYNCSKCSDKNKCITCKDPAAYADKNGVCKCKEEYQETLTKNQVLKCISKEEQYLIDICAKSSTFTWKAFTNEKDFNNIQELNKWSVNRQNQNKISSCGQTKIFGGYEILNKGSEVQRQLTNIPAHSAIQIAGNLFAIDESNDEFNRGNLQISLSDKNIDDFKRGFDFDKQDLCGKTNLKDSIKNFNKIIKDNKQLTEIIFKDNSVQISDNSSWGFRDITLQYCKCHSSCQACDDQGKCISCKDINAIVSEQGECICKDDYFLISINPFKCVPKSLNILQKQFKEEEVQSLIFKYFTEEQANQNDLSDWKLVHQNINQTTFTQVCNNNKIFGLFGNSTLLVNNLVKLPAHFAVEIQADIYVLDYFDNYVDKETNPSLHFKIGESDTYKYQQQFDSDTAQNICGNPDYVDRIWKFTTIFEHTNQNLKINIYDDSKLSVEFASWGIKDLVIKIIKCHSTCNECKDHQTCLSCIDQNAVKDSNSGICICKEGYKLDSNFKCKLEIQDQQSEDNSVASQDDINQQLNSDVFNNNDNDNLVVDEDFEDSDDFQAPLVIEYNHDHDQNQENEKITDEQLREENDSFKEEQGYQ